MIGETVRTTADNDVWHAVVGASGEPHWDVHPSRAGLTKVRAWGLIVPTPLEWRSSWAGEECACSACTSADPDRARVVELSDGQYAAKSGLRAGGIG
jgi:hypothetical protein